MLEKMYTTKMSADKKALQKRFLKIRIQNGRLSKIVALLFFLVVVAIIAAVSLYVAAQKREEKNSTEAMLTKEKNIEQALAADEKILTDSGLNWNADAEKVRALIDILNQYRQMPYVDIEKKNYDVTIYSIENKDGAAPRMFLMAMQDNGEMEFLFSMDLNKKEYAKIINLFESTDKEFEISDFDDMQNLTLIIGGKKYPVVNHESLRMAEKMLSSAKKMNIGSGCPFVATLVIENKNNEKSKIELAADSCAVFKNDDIYYDYSDGDNALFYSLFGLDNQNLEW